MAKPHDSPLWTQAPAYRAQGDNRALREALSAEQRGFCAYSEQRFGRLGDCHVEHFDRRLKGTQADGYANQYAVLAAMNQAKRQKEKAYAGASFFRSRFFQDAAALVARIVFDRESSLYFPADDADEEAAALIDFVGANDERVVTERKQYVRALLDALPPGEAGAAWLREHPSLVSFPTALAAHLGIDVDRLV